MVTRNDSRHERNLRPPQKGLPRFRYQSIEAEVADASTSIRRWWWEYLRLSKAYWLVCRMSHNMQTPRTKDEGLATLYRAFGNVHRYSFEDWWRRIGSDLFKEPESSPRVIEINQDLSNYSANRENRLLIEIPIKLSRRTIQRQIGRILTQYENQRPRNRLELAEGSYRLTPNLLRAHTLQKIHEVHCLHRELVVKPEKMYQYADTNARQRLWKVRFQKKADLYRIGKLLRISPSNEELAGYIDEIKAKQNRMRASVGRYLKRAEQLIANVEQGKFPVFANVEPRGDDHVPRITSERLRDLEHEWWSLNLTSQLSGDKIDKARRIYYAE